MNLVIAKQRLLTMKEGIKPGLSQFLQHAKRNKKFLIVAAVIFTIFYWYEIRPIRIHRYCAAQAAADARGLLGSKAEIIADSEQKAYYVSLLQRNMYLRSDYESFYGKCLRHYAMD